MYRLITVDVLSLTPQLAKTFSAMKKVPGERPLRSARMKFFDDHIKNATFGEPSWSTGKVVGEQDEYRMDGQHTSTVLAGTPVEIFPKDKKVAIFRYELDSLKEDGALLFDKFDNPKSTRTNGDAMNFLIAEYDDMEGIENSLCSQVGNGIAEYEKSKKKDGRPLDPRRHGLYFESVEYRLFANWINELSQENAIVNDWLFAKPGVVAEMISDWKTDKDTAAEFWMYVLKESHPDRDHITRELAEDFKKWRVRPEKHRPAVYRQHARRAWTKYRKDVEYEKMSKGHFQPRLEPDQPTV